MLLFFVLVAIIYLVSMREVTMFTLHNEIDTGLLTFL